MVNVLVFLSILTCLLLKTASIELYYNLDLTQKNDEQIEKQIAALGKILKNKRIFPPNIWSARKDYEKTEGGKKEEYLKAYKPGLSRQPAATGRKLPGYLKSVSLLC